MVLKDAETALVASAGDPRPERPERPVLRLRIILLEMLWKLFDGVVLFRMGTIYLHRFADFPHAHEVYDDEVDEEISMWRITQQEEWNRLSTSVSPILGSWARYDLPDACSPIYPRLNELVGLARHHERRD